MGSKNQTTKKAACLVKQSSTLKPKAAQFTHGIKDTSTSIQMRPKLSLTRSKKTILEIAQKVRFVRIKSSAELEKEMLAKVPKFKARPLNKQILKTPSLPIRPRSTPQTPDFHEFHFKTALSARPTMMKCLQNLEKEKSENILKFKALTFNKKDANAKPCGSNIVNEEDKISSSEVWLDNDFSFEFPVLVEATTRAPISMNFNVYKTLIQETGVTMGSKNQTAKKAACLIKQSSTLKPKAAQFTHDIKDTSTSIQMRPKLSLTRSKKPILEIAQKVRSVRIKSSVELEEEMLAKVPKFKARPLNKQILKTPLLPLRPRSTPQTPDFHVTNNSSSFINNLVVNI